MVRIQRFHCRGLGSVPGWGTKIPQGSAKKKVAFSWQYLEKINRMKHTLIFWYVPKKWNIHLLSV